MEDKEKEIKEHKWLFKLVRPKSYYQIPDKEYFVTGCIQNRFCIMATDYNPRNCHFISFDLAPEEWDLLDDRFEILGDYNNIEYEILYIFKEGGLVDTYNFTNKVETKDNPILLAHGLASDEIEAGSRFFDIGWVSTTGQRFREIVEINKENWYKSKEQIYQDFEDLRDWCKVGYLFYNYETCIRMLNKK